MTVVHCDYGCSGFVAPGLGGRSCGNRTDGRDGIHPSRLLPGPTVIARTAIGRQVLTKDEARRIAANVATSTGASAPKIRKLSGAAAKKIEPLFLRCSAFSCSRLRSMYAVLCASLQKRSMPCRCEIKPRGHFANDYVVTLTVSSSCVTMMGSAEPAHQRSGAADRGEQQSCNLQTAIEKRGPRRPLLI